MARLKFAHATSVALLTAGIGVICGGVAIKLSRTALAQAQAYNCPPTARVEAGISDNFERSDILCDGHEIQNPVGLEILCLASRRFVLIEDRTQTFDSDITCEQSAVLEDGGNSICNEGYCFTPKSPRGEQFQILQPDTISGPTPNIEWQAVPGAQSYTVYIVGPDVQWQRTVAADETMLAYPNIETPLRMDNAYAITITANQDGLVVASASQAINIRRPTASRLPLHLAARTNVAQ